MWSANHQSNTSRRFVGTTRRGGAASLCSSRWCFRSILLLAVVVFSVVVVLRFRAARGLGMRRVVSAEHNGGTTDIVDALVPDVASMSEGDMELETILRRKGTEFPGRLFHYVPAEPPRQPQNSAADGVGGLGPAPMLPDGVCVDCYALISMHPRVYLFRNIVSATEAAALRQLGEPLLSRSGVFAKQSIQRNVRSSYGARLPNDDPTAKALNERLLYILNNFTSDKARRTFRAGYSERLELLKYEGSQNYYGHLDNFGGIDGPLARQRRQRIKSFRTKLASLEAAQRSISKRNQRVNADASMCSAIMHDWREIREPLLDRGATMIVFLNDLDPATPGGHTTFPFAATGFNATDPTRSDESNPLARDTWRRMLQGFRTSKDDACANRSEDAASDGPAAQPNGSSVFTNDASPTFLKVKPALGNMLLFYDLYENGVSDPFALHSGCPPIREAALDAMASNMARVMPPGIANASQVRSRLEKQFTKTVVTKWFMLPIVSGVSKPEQCANRL